MKKVRTVAVIGGGVAGLSAAGLLSKNGYKVKLFEANDKLGGSCASSDLAGYILDDGALYLALPGLLDRVFDILGLDRSSVLPLRKITANQTTRLPGNTTVTIGEGFNISVERDSKIVTTPDLQGELTRFVHKWAPIIRLFENDLIVHPFSYSRLIAKGWRHLHIFRGTVASELDKAFSNDAVRSAMSGILLYSGLPPERTPVTSILGLVAMLKQGFYLPEFGMGKIPEILGRLCRDNGCEIWLESEVTRIKTKNGRVWGLETARHGLIEADAVISTVSGMVTYLNLLGSDDITNKMRRKAQKAPLSHKTFCIQLGLSNTIPAPSYSNSILPMMKEQYQYFEPGMGKIRWLNYTVPTVAIPELAPINGSIVYVFPPVDQALSADEWEDEKEDELTESAIELLSNLHPVDIKVKRVFSPKQYQNSMRLYRGAIYGLSPAASPSAQFPHRSFIEGLFLAGQTTYPGYGVGPATMSGIFAAKALMKASGG